MKVTWEPEDIRPGRRFSRPGLNEIHMIGFIAPGGKDSITWISLRDGMTQPPCTKEELAYTLNKAGYQPIEIIDRQ